MIFEGKTLPNMGAIFNKALDLAESSDGDRCQTFLTAYANWITEANGCNIKEATKIAKGNLGYFAGYYSREVYETINKAYGAVHPVFGGNPFDVSPEDAYNWGKICKDIIDSNLPEEEKKKCIKKFVRNTIDAIESNPTEKKEDISDDFFKRL